MKRLLISPPFSSFILALTIVLAMRTYSQRGSERVCGNAVVLLVRELGLRCRLESGEYTYVPFELSKQVEIAVTGDSLHLCGLRRRDGVIEWESGEVFYYIDIVSEEQSRGSPG